jgi:transcriptional regulator with XRE-family HTH domain
MMGNTNINWISMNDKSIIEFIGNYIKQQCLAQNKTQKSVAEHAGVNRWTISQIENGDAISLTSLIQILRTLDLLNIFNALGIDLLPIKIPIKSNRNIFSFPELRVSRHDEYDSYKGLSGLLADVLPDKYRNQLQQKKP